jgi:hypothetical protein
MLVLAGILLNNRTLTEFLFDQGRELLAPCLVTTGSSILVVDKNCLGQTVQDSTSMGTENDLRVALHQLESMLEEKTEVDRLWVLYEKRYSRYFSVQLGNKPVNKF